MARRIQRDAPRRRCCDHSGSRRARLCPRRSRRENIARHRQVHSRAPSPHASPHMPPHARPIIFAPSGSPIILSAEDSVGDTLRPRLEAAGADLARVHVLKAAVAATGTVRTFNLQSDLGLLGQKVAELGDVVTIVVDPITSYMGKI